jgi:hypothetical protein
LLIAGHLHWPCGNLSQLPSIFQAASIDHREYNIYYP